LQLSIFGDSTDVARRTESLARKEQLDRNVAEEISFQIPANGLKGSWAILEEDERSDETPLELYPQRIFFGENEFQKGVFDQVESKGKYTIDKRDLTSWSLHFLFQDQNVTPVVVQWISKDEVKLILADGDTTFVLRRIGSGQVSPFKRPKEQGTQKTGDGTQRPHTSRSP
jgi:hypothetical protein